MASSDPRSLEASDDPSTFALESHLHGLALSGPALGENNLTRGPKWENRAQSMGVPPLASAMRQTSMGPAQQYDPSPKLGKRRLNQAQRRQMSSQLSIPVDPRPQQTTHQVNFGPGPQTQLHRQRPDQRFSYLPVNPAVGPDPLHAHVPRRSPHWDIEARNRSTTLPWNSQFGHHGRQGPHSSFAHDFHSTGNARHSAAVNSTQRQLSFRPEDLASQAELLERLAFQVVSRSEIDVPEIAQKEAFRQHIETICRDVIAHYEQHANDVQAFPPLSVELKCFGSLSSGFATKASDMDLGLLSPLSRIPPDAAESPIPRLLEKALLDAGLGARLLSRTRVPIIKLCEQPPECLRQALLAERDKWENGGDTEGQQNTIDDDFDCEVGGDGGELQTSPSKPGIVESPSANHFEIPGKDDGPSRRFNLYQGPDHTLSSYYGLAKRLLRKAGGRDVTMSNQRELTAHEWLVLNRLCQAFVQGLSDASLRERLAHYPSLAFPLAQNTPHNRSLLGVYTQIEGEQALQKWEDLLAQEAFADMPRQAEQALSIWTNVQWRNNYGVDPISYTKDLQMALDKIKRLSSVQLVLLEQDQHETPSQYFARAKGILAGLHRGPGDAPPAIQEELVHRYIMGIAQDGVRKLLGQRISQAGYQVCFDAVGLWHKSIHLFQSLDRAAKKGAVKAVHVQDLTEYLSLLESPIHQIQVDANTCKLVIPVPPESKDLILRIRRIEGINDIIANQPRDRYRDPLEFPTSGVGVQCDINFSALLALHNTALLRCYSLTDQRVRPMVLFVKHWAKSRGINSGYRGTLSSYGYVLMVLHYLVNVVRPFVCPNLQQLVPQPPPHLQTDELDPSSYCQGCDIRFWRNENEIMHLAASNQLNHNTDGVGQLLRGFFEYYAQIGTMSSGLGKGFDWGRDVLSLRTPGGLLTKQEKGWTGAKTVIESQGPSTTFSAPMEQVPAPVNAMGSFIEVDDNREKAQVPKRGPDVKEVRHRYLFAIEDPFELDHNVARTVTHNGIVSIRDEFRRAWRIIRSTSIAGAKEDLLQDVRDGQESDHIRVLMDEIHGPAKIWGVGETI
ncbi:hypothetical protein HIM_00903 [Hirsutella minnesotensis 3608]|nr:hypothetical protein HIM_00903 [Hirsutella minnesotensis 3608]